jgi:predicted O-methyltransferase YrrM
MSEWDFRKMCINVEEYEFSLRQFMKLAEPHHLNFGLEVGTGWGVSADLFLTENPEAHLISVDIDQTRPAIQALAEKHGSRILCVPPGPLVAHVNPVDWLYIDGDHSYEGARSDILLFEPFLRPGGILVIDDVYGTKYPQPGVLPAVNELIKKEKYWPAIVIGSESGPVAFIKRS